VRLAYLLVIAGCGRVGFDPRASAGDATVTPNDAVDPVCDGVRLICDGFESATIGGAWNSAQINGSVTIDSVHVHRGTRAFHAHTNAGASGDTRKAEVSDNTSLPMSSTPRILYARTWAFFPSPHNAAYNQFITFANGAGGFALGDQNLEVVTNHFNSTDFAESATQALPLDRWACFQFEIPTDQTGTMRGFVDGVEVADLAVPISPAEATMTQVFIGIDWNLDRTVPATDVWFDDVIVDDAPISCAD
jgi:hypothetical protein